MKNKIGVITSFYRGTRYLNSYFEGLVKINPRESIEVIFVHNAPTKNELSSILQYTQQLPFIFKHIIVEELESIYASWNRAILESSCDYYTFWNVDDYRDPYSILQQSQTLQKYPEVGVTYGDWLHVTHSGQLNGSLVEAPEFSKEFFLRNCIEGPFVMLRSSITSKYGLFDEQFKSGGDFDYWARLVANDVIMKKTRNVITGHFLDEGKGASTDGSGIQPLERTVVELRYGAFDKIDYKYLRRARKYDIRHLYFNSNRFSIHNYLENYDNLIKTRRRLWLKSVPNNFQRFKNDIFLLFRQIARFLLPEKLYKFLKLILTKLNFLKNFS